MRGRRRTWHVTGTVRLLSLGFATLAVCAGAWEEWTNLNEDHPTPRAGHSTVLFGGTVLLFGGRDNNKIVEHRPMTFEIDDEDGELNFKSYDDNELTNCTGVSSELCDTYPNVQIGEYNNDVWRFDLNRKHACENEIIDENYVNGSCAASNRLPYWKRVDPGAQFGGCILAFGTELCTHPAERYNHAAAIFHDRYMLIYGGFSPWCTDYCDDVWIFDTQTYMWSEIRGRGSSDGLDATTSPGKRWQSANLFRDSSMYMFGGHRKEREGGFLNDFWKLSLGDSSADVSYRIRVHKGGSTENPNLLGNDVYYLDVAGDSVSNFRPTVSQNVEEDRTKWRIHMVDSSVDPLDVDAVPTCVALLIASARGDLEEEVTCEESGSQRIVVEIESVATGGFLGYTPFLGVYMSRISDPPYTQFVLENVGRNGYIMFPINSAVLKFVTMDTRNASVVATSTFADWTLDDLPEGARFFFETSAASFEWTFVTRKTVCYPSPGSTWEERSNVECTSHWPSKRSLAAMSIVDFKNSTRIYLHGGYNVRYPHPETDPATFTLKHPKATRYLSDMWMYDLSTGFWNEVRPIADIVPSGRMGHSIFSIQSFGNSIVMLFGGYRSNVFFQDVWEYNLVTNAWREKVDFTIPIYPESCSEDGMRALQIWERETATDQEQFADRQCYALGGTSLAPYDSIPPITTPCVFPNYYANRTWNGCIPGHVRPPEPASRASTQVFEYPDDFDWCITTPMGAYPMRWGYCHCASCNQWDDNYPCCRKDKDAPGIVAPASCCSITRSAATIGDTGDLLTAPESVCDQALDLFDCWDDYCYAGENDVGNLSMSVWGQPTRNSELDDELKGRELFLHQPRRQRPGWDGCRDRFDQREDLDPGLMWRRPSQRWNHGAVYDNETGVMLVTGGVNYLRPERETFDYTASFETVSDVWAYDINKCAHDCSGHGDCVLGYCFCFDGYYGLDCSNTSCPGDYCYYDSITWKQVCRHCCNSNSLDPDDVGNIFEEKRSRKVACSATEVGVENGICDGFGHCQCRPPMIGDDCSIRDCPNDCSAHGVCAMEYPQARCICEPKWTGEDCSSITCLNNCSYPWGECNDGVCDCKPIMNPYNNTMVYAYYEGPDCSYITPYAASHRALPGLASIVTLVVAVTLLVTRDC